MNALRAKVFAGWPEQSEPLKLRPSGQWTENGLRFQAYAFDSQPDVSLWLLVLQDAKVKKPEKVLLTVLDAESWTNAPAKWLWLGGGTAEAMAALRQEMQARKLGAGVLRAARSRAQQMAERSQESEPDSAPVTCCWARRSTA